jgi:hypothetical protein
VQVNTAHFSRVGIAVNGAFTGSQAELKQLLLIKEQLKAQSLTMRLHPTHERKSGFPAWLTISSPHLTVKQFSESVDIVFVGNSAVQLKILASGTPVCHVPGLDIDGFDRYEYVASGIVYGINDLRDFSPRALREFYRKRDYIEQLAKALVDGHRPDVGPSNSITL